VSCVQQLKVVRRATFCSTWHSAAPGRCAHIHGHMSYLQAVAASLYILSSSRLLLLLISAIMRAVSCRCAVANTTGKVHFRCGIGRLQLECANARLSHALAAPFNDWARALANDKLALHCLPVVS
jgi:hypothetical protein